MLYKKIEKFCTEKGITISAIEKEAGLGNGTIGKWKTVNPTIANVRAVAKILNCSVDDLLSQE